MPSDIEQTWISDGTKTAEPVTTETPAAEAQEAAPEPAGPPRDEAGRFAPRQPEGAAPAATEAVPAPPAAPGPDATAEQVADYIEALLGEEPYQLPRSVRLPLKRNGVVEHVPVDEALNSAMRGRDYTAKMTELKALRGQFDQERSTFAAEQARLRAQAEWVAEQERNYQQILRDPQAAAAYQEHLDQYQRNPIYRQNVDQALRARELEAQNQAYQQRDESVAIARGVELANEWITDLSEQYPTVDPGRVRELYASALSSGRAGLDAREVENIFRSEATYVEKSVTPLQQELASLKAQIEALTASQSASAHNAATAHAVARAASPRVAAGSSPPAPAARPKQERFGINELAQRNAEWSRQR
jgi:hypothetical protein